MDHSASKAIPVYGTSITLSKVSGIKADFDFLLLQFPDLESQFEGLMVELYKLYELSNSADHTLSRQLVANNGDIIDVNLKIHYHSDDVCDYKLLVYHTQHSLIYRLYCSVCNYLS